LIIDSLENASEALTLGIPFGPFQFGLQYYPWAPGNAGDYPLKTDRSGQAHPHFAALLMYSAGNISSQTFIEYTNGHKGLEALLVGPTFANFPTIPIFVQDASTVFGFTNFRYFKRTVLLQC